MRSLQPPAFQSLGEGVAASLREAILEGDLPPGARLVEAEIAQQMGTSRGPVREAIRRLASEGLVEYRTNRGAWVTTLAPRDGWEVYTLRGMLEAWALELGGIEAARKGLPKLRAILVEMGKLTEDDLSKAVQLDLAFHGALVSGVEHRRLQEMYHRLDGVLSAMFLTAVRVLRIPLREMVPQHRPIAEAVATGDLATAVSAVREHYFHRAEQLRALEGPRGARRH